MRGTKSGVFYDIYNQPYDDRTRLKLYTSSKASLQLIQRMALLKRLKVHNGCVNSICWNASGTLILSGSDDQHLVLTNPYNYQVLTDYKTSHRANIFSAKFLPNSGDHRIVSCSGDGIILYTDLMRRTATFQNQFTCHSGTTYEIATIPGEPHSFLSCGEDGTVRGYDLRVKEKCNTPRCKEDVMISCQKAVTALSVNPLVPHQVAIGCSDSTVRTFDRRMLATRDPDNGESAWPTSIFSVPEFEGNSYRITSLSYSPDGQDVLVSYSSDHLYLFSIKDQGSMQMRKDASTGKNKSKKNQLRSPQPVRRLRLRGDWSDTGPDARPESEGGRLNGTEIAQARPILHTSLMQRMTDVLSRMLNDPATRAALNGSGDDNLEGWIIDQQGEGAQQQAQQPQQQQQNQQNQATGEESVEPSAESANGNEASSHQAMEIEAASSAETRESDELSTVAIASNPSEDSSNALAVDVSTENEIEETVTQESDEIFCESEESHIVNNSPTESDTEETRNETNNVPMGSESSRTEASKTSIQSFTSLSISRGEETRDSNRNDSLGHSSPTSNLENPGEGNIMENLQDRLTTMRHGFLERHGSEPAVSLTYSDKSSTGATISLGVANEVIRDNYHPGPSGSQNTGLTSAGPSSSRGRDPDFDLHERTDEDVYNDSDDEDADPTSCDRSRVSDPVDVESEKESGEERDSMGQETYEDSCMTEFHVKQKYMGHRNARTMIKEANFWGDDYVMSGSDCGHVFVWERDTAKLCMLLEADQHVVNCLQPHPFLPMLATSGIDYDVKLWAPISEEANFDTKFAEDLLKRNAVMLEETKDTITVPAAFMIRMLACLNQIRRGRGRNRRRSGDEADELRGG
ncbi:DDB1- and CUL4-associated factor 6-like isoform X3 [Venturia canescens]|uniref:DDB1- and CUL4-associated factor 6-like isoform X3 n=1 Tax=Venturia canescens TaxID=32260 RepID=UPI001C9BE43C|nr:DDB1- and CUL4-associated factor 6-like isoform X3 [Venturia canescens]